MVNRKQFKVHPVEYGPITPRGQGSTLHVAHRTSHSGFTIIELLVSILLTSIIMTAVYSVYRVQTHSAKVQENRLEAQEYARSVLDMMVREIRNAGYAPTGAACAVVVSASSQTIQFAYDANANGVCTDADEDIEYRFDATGCSSLGNIRRLTRNGATILTDEPLTNCNVPTGTSNFSLTYYAQDSSTAMSPLVLANIQRVGITLTVQSLKPDTEFGGQLTVTMTSNADLRNRGLPS